MDITDPYLQRILEYDESDIPYVVLKLLENGYDLPVVVKYGDAFAVKSKKAIPDNDVWDAVPDDNDYLLFHVEIEDDLSQTETTRLHRTMLAIGAWNIGSAGTHPAGDHEWEHALFVWPKDHPVTELG